ncbi:MAG: zinc ribbon domain-containing protein, partial [Alphaproteobacteria bacterium]|nr:zinc ribbon domain-containing protein [Alphaproteobacteria bacterium]
MSKGSPSTTRSAFPTKTRCASFSTFVFCHACSHRFEEFQSMTAAPLTKCPACNKPKLERLIGCGLDAFCHNVTTIG